MINVGKVISLSRRLDRID